MWWFIVGALVACLVGWHRLRAARAWEDLAAARTQLLLLGARLERAQAALEALTPDASQSRANVQRDIDEVKDRLGAIAAIEARLVTAYADRVSPLSARLLSLPSPKA